MTPIQWYSQEFLALGSKAYHILFTMAEAVDHSNCGHECPLPQNFLFGFVKKVLQVTPVIAGG